MKTLNPLQQKILALEPLSRAGTLARELTKKIREQGTEKQSLPFNMGWALVLAFKAGHSEALEQAAALADTGHVIKRAINNGPGRPNEVYEEVMTLSEDDYQALLKRLHDLHTRPGFNQVHLLETEGLDIDQFLPVDLGPSIKFRDGTRILLFQRDLDLLTEEEWQRTGDIFDDVRRTERGDGTRSGRLSTSGTSSARR
jgi:hypothetical protein